MHDPSSDDGNKTLSHNAIMATSSGHPHGLTSQCHTDQQAIQAFLNLKRSDGQPHFSPNTQLSYEKELRRLTLYCQSQSISFNQINLNHVQQFIDWLSLPPEKFISKAKRSTINPSWQPFAGNLSATSVHQSVSVCKSFCSFLQKIGYLRLNPFSLMNTNTQAKKLQEFNRKNRCLSLSDIAFIRNYLIRQPNSPTIARMRWLFDAYLFSGLRLSELLNQTTDALRQESYQGKHLWLIYLIGKGGKPASIPLSQAFIESLKRYRQSLNKPSLPIAGKKEAFFFSLSGKKPLTSRQAIHNIFKSLIDSIITDTQQLDDNSQAERLRSSSIHWLRHSFVTVGLDTTGDIPAIAELARHSDIKTTMGYDKTEQLQLSELLDKMALTLSDPRPLD